MFSNQLKRQENYSSMSALATIPSKIAPNSFLGQTKNDNYGNLMHAVIYIDLGNSLAYQYTSTIKCILLS